MMEMMLAGKVPILPPDVRGEAVFTATGTTVWTCPPDVFSVCFVIVGPGENGDWSSSYASGGKGGGLRYRNNVSVTPGAKYNIVVGPAGANMSSAFGTAVGQYNVSSGPSDGGGNGAQGTRYSGQGTGVGLGGQGAYYQNGGGAGTQNLNQFIGPDLYGNNQRGTFGAAGGASKDGGGSGQAYGGRAGGVRIMWGRYRSFPNAAA